MITLASSLVGILQVTIWIAAIGVIGLGIYIVRDILTEQPLDME